MSVVDQELLHARRSWAESQELLAGEPLEAQPTAVGVGWHDTSVGEAGALAVVGLEAGLDDWVGEILRVDVGERHAFVYVLGTADVPVPLSIARRAFAALAPLSREELAARVWVIG